MLARVRDLPDHDLELHQRRPVDPPHRADGADFAAAFGVGADDRHIHPIDGQGVALAAIQGLIDRVENLREENARLAARLAALEQVPDGG